MREESAPGQEERRPAAVEGGLLADRRGHEVLDSEGERAGKVEAVYFDPDREEHVFVCIKTGLFGRRLTLVPLAGASADDDHLRLAYPRQQIKDAPAVEAGAELEGEQVRRVHEHYELEALEGPPGSGRLIRHQPPPGPGIGALRAPARGHERAASLARGDEDDDPPGSGPGAGAEDDLLERLSALERRMQALQKALD
jgi:hypothetical protein